MTTVAPPPTFDIALSRIRDIFADLAIADGERDQNWEHPYDQVRALADAGFGRLRVPTEFGGFDVDLPTLFDLLAEAGAADSNIPQIWRGHFTTTEILRRETDPVVRAHWFTRIADGAVFGNAQSEPSAAVAGLPETGGWGTLTTRVHVDDAGQRRVSGSKFYSTGSRFADYIRVAVAADPGDTESETPGSNRSFVVIRADDPGVEHVDDWDGVGQRQTGSGTTHLTDVPVADHGDIGAAQESLRGLDSFVQIVHLANLTGIARRVVDDTVAIVAGRTRTSRHALTQNASVDPDVLAVVGRLRARSLTAESLLHTVATTLDDAHRTDIEDDFAAAYLETSAAQIAVIDAVLDAAASAFDAGGSSTARNRVHLDRHWRNARTLASHNPVIYKPRIIGDHLVNGTLPVSGYYADRTRADETADHPADQPEGAVR